MELATGDTAGRRVIFQIFASALVFSGWQFPMLPSRAVNINIMLTWILIKLNMYIIQFLKKTEFVDVKNFKVIQKEEYFILI